MTPMQGKITALSHYIDENSAKNHTVDALAARFRISKYYLCHLFKEQTGHTLMGYIALRRIDRAKALMLEGYSSTEAAFAVGYNSYSAFYKHFRRHAGMTPREFQQAGWL